MSAFFPITIRGKDYIIVQKGNIVDIEYDDEKQKDKEIPEEEAEMVILYLMDEGFIK